MNIRITQLIPVVLIITTVISTWLLFTYNLLHAESNIREEALAQQKLDITRLQNVLYNLLTENNNSDARLNISVMVMDDVYRVLLLMDESNEVLIASQYRWEGEQAASYPGLDTNIANEVRRTNSQRVEFRTDNSMILNGYYPVVLKIEQESGLPVKRIGVLFSELDISKHFARVHQDAINTSVFLGSILMAVALFIAVLLYLRIPRRLGKLVSASETFARGDLDTELEIEGGDEITQLATAFDDMRKQLRRDIKSKEKAQRDLRDLNKTLEERVSTRTMMLREELEQRQLLEKQLQQAQKLESLGQLTGGIAHDFNNMLSSISGYTQLIKSMAAYEKDERLANYVDQVLTASNRAAELVKQMLVFSRTEGDIEKKETISAFSLIEETERFLRPIIPSSIELIVEPCEKSPLVNVNPAMINQVIMNLCLNARDAMENANGRLGMSISHDEFSQQYCTSCHQDFSGQFVEIKITDTGSGIDKGVFGRLFDPFFSTKEVGKGTGMGLSMVHGIVHKHNGHILIHTVPGQGTEVSVLLPVTKDHLSMNDKTIANDNIRQVIRGKTVLIVDDEVSITGYLDELLKSYNINVFVKNDSQEALRKFKDKSSDIDLVITDQTMPFMTGVELSQEILKFLPGMPIIMCTGYSEHINKQGALAIGIRNFIEKPIGSEEMINAIAEIFS